jgi:hypothetical protein
MSNPQPPVIHDAWVSDRSGGGTARIENHDAKHYVSQHAKPAREREFPGLWVMVLMRESGGFRTRRKSLPCYAKSTGCAISQIAARAFNGKAGQFQLMPLGHDR